MVFSIVTTALQIPHKKVTAFVSISALENLVEKDPIQISTTKKFRNKGKKELFRFYLKTITKLRYIRDFI